MVRYRALLERDVLSLGAGERLTHFGVFIAGLSAVALAFGYPALALGVFSLGGATTIAGVILHLRNTRKT